MASTYIQAFSTVNAREENPILKSNERFMETFCLIKNNNEKMIKNKRFSLTTSRTEANDTKKDTIPNISRRQLADRFRHGMAIQGGVKYKQTVVIRSSEVGADKNATLECILNILQESLTNHLRTLKIFGDHGFSVTPGMLQNNLILVYTKLSVEIDEYPRWDDVIEVDTWLEPSGKNALKTGWTIKNLHTGKILVRASGILTVINDKTRRLSKIPDEIKAKISPFYCDIEEEKCTPTKVEKLIGAKYIVKNLEPKRSDVDMNHHINNAKYANWMLEAIPQEVYEECQLSSIILEFKKECGLSDTIQSMCQPNEISALKIVKYMNQDLWRPSTFDFTHLLQVERNNKTKEIARGKTTWKLT
ncbi:hypothetical protein ACFE04_009498 [Oxalis oulophora]